MIGNQFLKNDNAFSVFDLCDHTPLIFHFTYLICLCEEYILKNRFYPKCKVKEEKKREGGWYIQFASPSLTDDTH